MNEVFRQTISTPIDGLEPIGEFVVKQIAVNDGAELEEENHVPNTHDDRVLDFLDSIIKDKFVPLVVSELCNDTHFHTIVMFQKERKVDGFKPNIVV